MEKIEVKMDLIYSEGKANLNIKVIDNGVGLNDEDITNILAGNKPSTDGTTGEVGFGFGLSMIKHLIEGLNGELKVNSELGKGSTFEIVLPIS